MAYLGRMRYADARPYRSPALRAGLLVVFALALVAAPSTAQERTGDPETLAEWIDRTNTHRIAGYVSLGLATTTAALGLLGVAYHPILGYSTAATTSVTVALGSIAYRDRLRRFWPHAVLASLATTGFLTNAIFLEGGSPAHIATGIASVSSLYAAYAAVVLLK